MLGGIDLDPASSEIAQKTVWAKDYFTKFEDALNLEWHGRVFMNPPYSRDGMPRFIEKLITEFRAGRVSQAIVLVHTQAGFREKNRHSFHDNGCNTPDSDGLSRAR